MKPTLRPPGPGAAGAADLHAAEFPAAGRHAAGFLVVGVLGAGVPAASLPGAEAHEPRLYEMTTETGMPHLEENLRYARKKEMRCVDIRDLSGAFWMLGEPSLQDCRLVRTSASPDAATYLLTCDGGHGTTGRATWQLEKDHFAGTLEVRLGGKNMTFYQRVTAKAVGSCG